jgi:hypothetical protein
MELFDSCGYSYFEDVGVRFDSMAMRTPASEPSALQVKASPLGNAQVSLTGDQQLAQIGCVKYVRMYADASGESHFEDVEMPLAPVDFAPSAPPMNVSAFVQAAAYGFLSFTPDWDGGWHPTPARQILLILKGEIEAQCVTGKSVVSARVASLSSRTLPARVTLAVSLAT